MNALFCLPFVFLDEFAGRAQEASEMFAEMQERGIKPGKVNTFVLGSLLKILRVLDGSAR